MLSGISWPAGRRAVGSILAVLQGAALPPAPTDGLCVCVREEEKEEEEEDDDETS